MRSALAIFIDAAHIGRMSKTLKAGVIGAGVFGGYHASKYAAHDEADLTAIYDVIADRRDALAAQYGALSCETLSEFVDAIDIATIASPAIYHYHVARALLKAGKSVLIEKPITAAATEAEFLIELAKENDAVIAVGHQERLVFGAMGLFTIPERPIKIEAVRMGPQSARCTDVSVTLDLLIHDADLVLALLGESQAVSVTAKGQNAYTEEFDRIDADITFKDTSVHLIASRMHDKRERWMRVTYPSGHVYVDFITREFDNTTPFDLDENFTEKPQAKDSLGTNVSCFIAAVKDRSSRPAVTGEDGLYALMLARDIDRAASGVEARFTS